jgi:hypothetical protein
VDAPDAIAHTLYTPTHASSATIPSPENNNAPSRQGRSAIHPIGDDFDRRALPTGTSVLTVAAIATARAGVRMISASPSRIPSVKGFLLV